MKFFKKQEKPEEIVKNEVANIFKEIEERIKMFKPFIEKVLKDQDLTPKDRKKLLDAIVDYLIQYNGVLFEDVNRIFSIIGTKLSYQTRQTLSDALELIIKEKLKEKINFYNSLVNQYEKIPETDNVILNEQVEQLELQIENIKNGIDRLNAALPSVQILLSQGMTLAEETALEIAILRDLNKSQEEMIEYLILKNEASIEYKQIKKQVETQKKARMDIIKKQKKKISKINSQQSDNSNITSSNVTTSSSLKRKKFEKIKDIEDI